MCENPTCIDDYQHHFESFMQTKLGSNIYWVPHGRNINFANQKYLLLIDVKTRIPEEIADTLDCYTNQG